MAGGRLTSVIGGVARPLKEIQLRPSLRPELQSSDDRSSLPIIHGLLCQASNCQRELLFQAGDEGYGAFDVWEDAALGGFFGVDDGAAGVDDEEGSDGHAALFVEDAVGAADFAVWPEVGED